MGGEGLKLLTFLQVLVSLKFEPREKMKCQMLLKTEKTKDLFLFLLLSLFCHSVLVSGKALSEK